MKIAVAIQCMDTRTRQVGSFGFSPEKRNGALYSVTPVFMDCYELFKYCHKHGIETMSIDEQNRAAITQ